MLLRRQGLTNEVVLPQAEHLLQQHQPPWRLQGRHTAAVDEGALPEARSRDLPQQNQRDGGILQNPENGKDGKSCSEKHILELIRQLLKTTRAATQVSGGQEPPPFLLHPLVNAEGCTCLLHLLKVHSTSNQELTFGEHFQETFKFLEISSSAATQGKGFWGSVLGLAVRTLAGMPAFESQSLPAPASCSCAFLAWEAAGDLSNHWIFVSCSCVPSSSLAQP